MNANLTEALASIQEDIDAVTNWSTELYMKKFDKFFHTQRELYERLKSQSHTITDDELESILTTVPLDLFSCAEALNELRLHQEIIKMKIKETEINTQRELKDLKMTQTEIKDAITSETLENKLVSVVLENLISRVEKECTFSKELVMSAKKIWDRRRESEGAAGIHSAGSAEPDCQLPDYTPNNTGRRYIG